MKKLAFVMVEDWSIYSKFSHEYNILCRNYAMGRKVTIAYAGKNHIENFMTLEFDQVYIILWLNLAQYMQKIDIHTLIYMYISAEFVKYRLNFYILNQAEISRI